MGAKKTAWPSTTWPRGLRCLSLLLLCNVSQTATSVRTIGEKKWTRKDNRHNGRTPDREEIPAQRDRRGGFPRLCRWVPRGGGSPMRNSQKPRDGGSTDPVAGESSVAVDGARRGQASFQAHGQAALSLREMEQQLQEIIARGPRSRSLVDPGAAAAAAQESSSSSGPAAAAAALVGSHNSVQQVEGGHRGEVGRYLVVGPEVGPDISAGSRSSAPDIAPARAFSSPADQSAASPAAASTAAEVEVDFLGSETEKEVAHVRDLWDKLDALESPAGTKVKTHSWSELYGNWLIQELVLLDKKLEGPLAFAAKAEEELSPAFLQQLPTAQGAPSVASRIWEAVCVPAQLASLVADLLRVVQQPVPRHEGSQLRRPHQQTPVTETARRSEVPAFSAAMQATAAEDTVRELFKKLKSSDAGFSRIQEKKKQEQGFREYLSAVSQTRRLASVLLLLLRRAAGRATEEEVPLLPAAEAADEALRQKMLAAARSLSEWGNILRQAIEPGVEGEGERVEAAVAGVGGSDQERDAVADWLSPEVCVGVCDAVCAVGEEAKEQQEMAEHLRQQEASSFLSVGSVGHHEGKCFGLGCKFFQKKRCWAGGSCPRCHLCLSDTKKGEDGLQRSPPWPSKLLGRMGDHSGPTRGQLFKRESSSARLAAGGWQCAEPGCLKQNWQDRVNCYNCGAPAPQQHNPQHNATRPPSRSRSAPFMESISEASTPHLEAEDSSGRGVYYDEPPPLHHPTPRLHHSLETALLESSLRWFASDMVGADQDIDDENGEDINSSNYQPPSGNSGPRASLLQTQLERQTRALHTSPRRAVRVSAAPAASPPPTTLSAACVTASPSSPERNKLPSSADRRSLVTSSSPLLSFTTSASTRAPSPLSRPPTGLATASGSPSGWSRQASPSYIDCSRPLLASAGGGAAGLTDIKISRSPLLLPRCDEDGPESDAAGRLFREVEAVLREQIAATQELEYESEIPKLPPDILKTSEDLSYRPSMPSSSARENSPRTAPARVLVREEAGARLSTPVLVRQEENAYTEASAPEQLAEASPTYLIVAPPYGADCHPYRRYWEDSFLPEDAVENKAEPIYLRRVLEPESESRISAAPPAAASCSVELVQRSAAEVADREKKTEVADARSADRGANTDRALRLEVLWWSSLEVAWARWRQADTILRDIMKIKGDLNDKVDEESYKKGTSCSCASSDINLGCQSQTQSEWASRKAAHARRAQELLQVVEIGEERLRDKVVDSCFAGLDATKLENGKWRLRL